MKFFQGAFLSFGLLFCSLCFGASAPQGRYFVGEQIGKGSYACVFEAIDRETGQVVALKEQLKSPETVNNVRVLQDVFLSLRQGLASQAYVSPSGSAIWTVMRLFPKDLHEILLDEHPVNARLVFASLAHGLARLHEANIVHGDLKPANVLVDIENNFECHLCDFGSATHVDLARAALAKDDHLCTAWYRAPECLKVGFDCKSDRIRMIKPTVGRPFSLASDNFALGAILAELMIGPALFRTKGDYDELILVMHKNLQYLFDDLDMSIVLPTAKPWAVHTLDQARAMAKMAILEAKARGNFDLLKGLLNLDPEKRLTIRDVLAHPYVRDCAEFVPSGPALGSPESLERSRKLSEQYLAYQQKLARGFDWSEETKNLAAEGPR